MSNTFLFIKVITKSTLEKIKSVRIQTKQALSMYQGIRNTEWGAGLGETTSRAKKPQGIPRRRSDLLRKALQPVSGPVAPGSLSELQSLEAHCRSVWI